MKKMGLFYRLNRQHVWKYMMLFIVFAFAGVVVSSTLFIQKNNKEFYEAQIKILEQEQQLSGDRAANLQEFQLIFDRVEDVLLVFSFVSILIVIWGGVNLLFFKDLSMQKSYAMCRIYGMKQSDLVWKALGDLLIYGIAAGMAGSAGGYVLFRYLAVHVCQVDAVIGVLSPETVITAVQVILILSVISFCGSFSAGIFVYQKHIMNILFERQEKTDMKNVWYVAAAGLLVIALLILSMFQGNKKYIGMVLAAFGITALLLYVIFHFLFSKQTKKYRNRKPLNTLGGLSYRFLCTRYKKDAILAATISVGAVIICFIMNLEFNFSAIITDSYRDNMGYSIGARVQDFSKTQEVADRLEANGYQYTLIYSKLMDYAELNNSALSEGSFWAAVIGAQTEGNPHYALPEGTFLAENSFAAGTKLKEGNTSGILGNGLKYGGSLKDNQALSLVSYNILVNERDWVYGLDESWSAVFLMDVDKAGEKQLQILLEGSPCDVETAAEIVDAVSDLMSEYLSVVLVVGTMLVLVIGTFFYSMIQNDFIERKTEIYLYQIYGASPQKAQGVILAEYLMIALSASFSVVFVIMVLGELFFFYLLHRHYPISIVVVLLTTLIVTAFVLFCCLIAGTLNGKRKQLELIRDE